MMASKKLTLKSGPLRNHSPNGNNNATKVYLELFQHADNQAWFLDVHKNHRPKSAVRMSLVMACDVMTCYIAPKTGQLVLELRDRSDLVLTADSPTDTSQWLNCLSASLTENSQLAEQNFIKFCTQRLEQEQDVNTRPLEAVQECAFDVTLETRE